MASKHSDGYRTIEQRFGKGASLPGHRGGSPVEKVGGQWQKKLTPKQERQALGSHMRVERARRLERAKSTDDRDMVFGKDKFE